MNKEATKLKRIGAYLIDSLFIAIVSITFIWLTFFISPKFSYVIPYFMPRLFSLFLIILVFVNILYFLLKDSLFNGASIGKYLLKIRVVDKNNNPCNKTKSLIRNLFLIIPILNLIEFLFFIFEIKHRRIGDRVANTYVINSENRKIVRFPFWIFWAYVFLIIFYIVLLVLANNFISKDFVYTVNLSAVDNSSATQSDLNLILQRLALGGYYSEGELKISGEKNIIMLHTFSDIYNNPEAIYEDIKKGGFEAKIGNQTTFIGGNRDITYVGRTGQDAMVFECFQVQEGEACNFRFVIYLSEEAANKQADITSSLSINPSSNGKYLDKKLDMYLDGKLVDSLNIGVDLKGKVARQIQISGSGIGATRQEAINAAKLQMKKLQTILITGHLEKDYMHYQ